MSKLLNTLLLSTALVCCGNSYSLDADGHYNVLYDKVNNDSGLNELLFSRKCFVGDGEYNHQLGHLYYKKDWETKSVKLFDEEGRPYYDLKTVVNNQTNPTISDYINKGGWNLIIKKVDENPYNEKIYKLNNPLTLKGGNTTLIVPNGVTLTKEDSPAKDKPLNILFESGNNNTLLVLGNIDAMNDKGWWSVVDFGKYDAVGSSDGNTSTKPQTTIAMPNAKVILADSAECSTECETAEYGCSFAGSNTSDTKIVMYPGVTLNHNIKGSNKSSSIAAYGNLYLNRFCDKNETSKRKQLKAKVAENVNVVYPTDVMETGFSLMQTSIHDNNSDLIYANSFPNTYLVGDQIDNKLHSFEDAKAPLMPVTSEDGEKTVLGFNTSNDMAKYDAKLWDECKLNEGKYSLVNYYNKPANKNIYFNTDDAHKLFKDVDKSDNPDDDPLKLETNKVFLGLLGNRDVEIVTEEDTVHFYGDNREFKGTLHLPGNVKYTKYESENSKIKNVVAPVNVSEIPQNNGDDPSQHNGDETPQNNSGETPQHNGDETPQNNSGETPQQNGDETPQNNSGETPQQNGDETLTEHTGVEEPLNNFCNHVWDLAIDGTTVEMDQLRSNLENSTLILTDSGTPKTKVIEITGDNSQFKGIIVTPPSVKEVQFYENSFVRTVNVNGSPLKYIFFGNNKVTDYNDYSLLDTNGYEVNVKPNNGAKHLKNGRKHLHVNVDKVNVCKNGALIFKPGTRLFTCEKFSWQ